MNFSIVGKGFAGDEKTELLREKPEFRRASRNMLLSFAAAQEACAGFDIRNQRISCVLGTSHGEMSETYSFLSELSISNTARPLFFQGSLHNATLGSLSHLLAITGPTVTVSKGYFTGEAALETAALLLSADQCDFSLVVCVESHPAALDNAFRKNYPETVQLSAGSSALLLKQGAEHTVSLTTHSKGGEPLSGIFCDSDFLAHFISAIEQTPAGGVLRLPKPDGSISVTEWTSSIF